MVYNFECDSGNYWQGDDAFLRMHIQQDRKIVELWLTKAERNNAAFQELLKPIYQQYKDQDYLIVVFLSGESDLYQQTRELLLYNRRRLAEQEVQAQKQSCPAMTT